MNRNKLPLILLLALPFTALVGNSCRNVKQVETVQEQAPAAAAAKPVHPKVEKLKLINGFQAEHLYSPSENKQGSWVSMAFDDKGRMIVSDQYGDLYRLQIPAIGASSVAPKIEKLKIASAGPVDPAQPKVALGFAQGLLYAFNSLYVMVNDMGSKDVERPSGLYRLQDTNGDDQYDKITQLKALKGQGEHGPHSVVLSPDKQSIYVIAGNHTDVPEMDTHRLPKVWQEDNLFPLIKDPRGHANDRIAPGGWIAKINPEGTHWELISAGYRNAFDMAFNEAGDLFAYDADMEWDFGMPWYRPTRINHVTSGSEFGWRTGNSKWSPAYPDNLPAVLNIGQGSPTNLIYGKDARFPEKYRRSLYAFDWSFGIIYAIQPKPDGASYSTTAEEFISGSPLPLTDGVIGPDGAMYFLTGGRRLESDLYRVYYGDNRPNTSELQPLPETPEKKIRVQLEQFHKVDAAALDAAWPYLKHSDRYIQYAARIAVEHQPVSQWQARALAEKDSQTLTQAMIALARHGDAKLKSRMLDAMMNVDFKQLSEPQQVDLVRAFELVLARMGKPAPAQNKKLISYLGQNYPAQTNELNRSLSKVLVYIDDPQVVSKTLALLDQAKDDDAGQKTVMASSDLILRNFQYGSDIAGMLSKAPPAQQMYYATTLSEAKTGWTPALRDKYFKWYDTAFSYKGGRSYVGFLDKARKSALQYVPKNQFEHYNTMSGAAYLTSSGLDLATAATPPKGPGKNWKMEDALPLVQTPLENRNFEQGKAMFASTMCISCHTMRGEGSAIGPDLTQLGTRFTTKDMLEAIIEPSKVISDQYASTVFHLKDGSSVLGRIISEDNTKYQISQNPFAPQTLREIPKKDVARTRVSETSIMMPGTINRLNEEEVKDLLAFLMSGGNKQHEVYSVKKSANEGK